ncbi:PAAR domain-containing protein [Iodobacter sp. CM08]|uniref:PAAR domain-containing protein n=1 Tax=Iodobacter sp. CM08 TaxID=3085902 RepID=UPI00298151FE|nr:PAAR domain-containing protein [Iodobacter sp. CM08]MDW5418944.1 PAAR domain-containing protein [Iodobacter sp. CM08]
MKRVIRLGDQTSHGGVVLSGASTTNMFGKPVALLGDKVSCPVPGHGVCPIVEGDPTWAVGGKAVALEGHKTSCGAVLISSMPEVGRAYEGSGTASRSKIAATAKENIIAATTTLAIMALIFDDKYQLIDDSTQTPLANHAYAIERENGDVEHGETDKDGHTHLLASVAKAENIKIYLEG